MTDKKEIIDIYSSDEEDEEEEDDDIDGESSDEDDYEEDDDDDDDDDDDEEDRSLSGDDSELSEDDSTDSNSDSDDDDEDDDEEDDDEDSLVDKVTGLFKDFGLLMSSSKTPQIDGHKTDCIRVLVDVERGRAVPNWLGGDLGPQELVENPNDHGRSVRNLGIRRKKGND
ncbi:unnamed protein product [Arabidopsis arenosa]|uniref:Uncharacterized protein n=1 Tax=Arabidopsis arenosa TaxID=38785 RepID=A0A8S2AED1_ARAAE|nr:unnamed protein product [Arabidopsis arenosa]